MSVLARTRLADRLATVGRGCRDVHELAPAVCAAVAPVVPFDFACLATTDPSTGLIGWAYKTRPLPVGDEEFAAAEYGGPDVNLFAEIACRAEPVGVLSIDTGGRPEECRRFREFLAPRFGFTDELRVVFRAQGLTWGALAVYRGQGEPPFTRDDAGALATVHEHVAGLLRWALFAPPDGSGAPPAPVGPAVVVVDGADRVRDTTEAARGRIEDLGGWDNGSLPGSVLAVAASARAGGRASSRVLGAAGTWLVLRASTLSAAAGQPASGPPDVVVTVDVAQPSDVSGLALAAHGLTAREQEVAALVLQGASTRAIAAALHLSPHTVQDHLKSIFAKLGVNSRRAMVAALVLA